MQIRPPQYVMVKLPKKTIKSTGIVFSLLFAFWGRGFYEVSPGKVVAPLESQQLPLPHATG